MVTKDEANFDLAMNSQAESVTMNVKIYPEVWINAPKIDIKQPVVNIEQPEITVSPVINLKADKLNHNKQGNLVLQ